MLLGFETIQQVYKYALKENKKLRVEKTLDCYYRVCWIQKWDGESIDYLYYDIGLLRPNDRPHPLGPTKGLK